jgi:hypothetical protein
MSLTTINTARAACGIAACCCGLLLAACSSGSPTLDRGARFLPEIATVDSGNVALANGLFDTEDQDLVVTDTSSNASFRLLDGNTIHSSQPIYDTDGDGDLDYVVLTMRALSASAQASTRTGADHVVPFDDFNLVGGAALLPLDATFSTGVTLTLPVHSAITDTTLDVYQFVFEGQEDGIRTATGIESVSGEWRFLRSVTPESGAVSITVNGGGQFGLVADLVPAPTAPTT